MRLVLVALSLALFAWVPAAQGATITFGSGSLSNPCSLSGNGADRSCTSSGSNTASTVTVVGQASADHGLTTNATAIADITLTYTVPYTVTRNVVVDPATGGPAIGNFEKVSIVFDANFSGAVATDNSQTFGGLGNARAYDATINGAFFSATVLTGSTGGVFNDGGPDPTYAPGINFSGARRSEADTDTFGIPIDWRAWDDFSAPFQGNYTDGFSVLQSFSDTLTITFRLRAESRPSGSISATGGEAIACAGQTSPLGAFDVDNGLNCGSGFTLSASAVTTETVQSAVPEPGTIVLVASGLAALAAFRGRRRA